MNSSVLPADLAALLARRARRCRRRYRLEFRRCRKKLAETPVHKLRTRIRRLLALLQLVESFKIGGRPGKIRRILKKRLNAFDELRDVHVQLRLLQPMWRDFPEMDRLKKNLLRQQARSSRRLARKIRDFSISRVEQKLGRLEKKLEQTAKPSSVSAAKQRAANALRPAFRRVVARRQKVDPKNSDSIHRMRVAFKSFRYMSEMLQPILPGLPDASLKRMKAYQDSAGQIQDLQVLLNRLDRIAKDLKWKKQSALRLKQKLERKKHAAIAGFMNRIDIVKEFAPRKSWTI